jgi:hypothetical protein
MSELDIARLLQSPLGQVASPGERGDMVRVSDGRAKIYLDPDEFDRASEADLRALLAAARHPTRAARDYRLSLSQPMRAPRVPARISSGSPSGRPVPQVSSLPAPRRAGLRP